MSDESSDDDVHPAAPVVSLACRLLEQQEGSDDEEDEDNPHEDPSAMIAKPAAAACRGAGSSIASSCVHKTSDCNGGGDDGGGSRLAQSALDRTGAGSTTTGGGCNDSGGGGSMLPPADELLAPGERPDFLRMPEGPEFDASKVFKPPAVSHADLFPAVRDSAGPHGRPSSSTLDDEPPEQRYHQEYNFYRAEGSVRLRGSVCHETDDERGRRVLYGAHAAAKADPWSHCNPNQPLKNFASGKKRKNGNT